jgi:hypothetical protein
VTVLGEGEPVATPDLAALPGPVPSLVAYVVADEALAPAGVLRAFLSEHLPAGLVPQRFVHLASRPLNRTCFVERDGVAAQRINPAARWAVDRRDVSALPPEERRAAVREMARTLTRQPLRLDAAPMARGVGIRESETDAVLVYALDHGIADGWSNFVFSRELVQLYAAGLAGADAALPALPFDTLDFAHDERARFADSGRRDLAFWTAHLRGAPARLDLPKDRPRPALQTFNGASVVRTLPAELGRALVQTTAGLNCAMTVLVHVEQRYGARLRPADLIDARTVRDLAAAIRGHAAAAGAVLGDDGRLIEPVPAGRAPVVPMEPKGTKPPSFFLHGWGGSVLSLLDLARALGPDQPAYGLQAVGADGSLQARRQSGGDRRPACAAHARDGSPRAVLSGRLFGGRAGGLRGGAPARLVRQPGRPVGAARYDTT